MNVQLIDSGAPTAENQRFEPADQPIANNTDFLPFN
jgi:hypothetical protein